MARSGKGGAGGKGSNGGGGGGKDDHHGKGKLVRDEEVNHFDNDPEFVTPFLMALSCDLRFGRSTRVQSRLLPTWHTLGIVALAANECASSMVSSPTELAAAVFCRAMGNKCLWATLILCVVAAQITIVSRSVRTSRVRSLASSRFVVGGVLI